MQIMLLQFFPLMLFSIIVNIVTKVWWTVALHLNYCILFSLMKFGRKLHHVFQIFNTDDCIIYLLSRSQLIKMPKIIGSLDIISNKISIMFHLSSVSNYMSLQSLKVSPAMFNFKCNIFLGMVTLEMMLFMLFSNVQMCTELILLETDLIWFKKKTVMWKEHGTIKAEFCRISPKISNFVFRSNSLLTVKYCILMHG